MTVVTGQPIQISYFVQDISSALLTYNRLRWHRSRTGQDGPYEAATGASAGPAVLVGALVEPHQLNGKTLSFIVNGVTQVDVTFADPDPVSTAQVVAAITGATALVVPSDDGNGRLLLTTVLVGSGASIEIILESAAALFLGLEGSAVGVDQDTNLVVGTHEYFYTDQNSDNEFWYRVEFRNSTTLVTTGLGAPLPANAAQHISKSLTIVGYVRIADMSGLPLPGRRITFANSFLPNTVIDQTTRWGIFRHYTHIETDRNGYAEVRLLRGMAVDVSIEGTGFARRIQIPTTGDVVDILDPALVAEDEFGIQRPNINFAIRTS